MSMEIALSPFLSKPVSNDDPTPSSDPAFEEVSIRKVRQQLDQIREAFPERSDYAVIDLDCCLLLAVQLSRSELQGFDLTVLLFLLAHFDHKRPTIKTSISEIARQLDRNVSQVRRAMRKLEQLGWVRFDRRGLIQLSPVIIRSANSKYRAIHFRHANNPFHRET